MKAIKRLLVVAVAGATLTACCGQCDKPKFDAKEYAKHKTERIDKIVELTDAQQSEVYALYLEQGKEMKKNIKAFKKECANMKQPDCKKAECDKPCDKAKCDKPCAKKAECDKAKCDKAKCEACPKKAECKKGECNKPCDKAKCDKPCAKKAECDKAKCDKAKCDKAKCEACPKKAECNKGECNKPCDKKAECKKGECNKPCAKKAECKKPECGKPCPPKPECGKPMMPRPHRPELVSPESKRATFEKLGTILTPEQNAKLKEHFTKRHACRPDKKACAPACAPVQK